VTGGHALVVTGGPIPANQGPLPSADLIIAADGGADNAAALGLTVDLVIGDLDSVSSAAVARAKKVERHPEDKDETDLELALSAAVAAGTGSVTVVGTLGGRVDHALANLLVAAGDRWANLRIDLRIDGAQAWVVRDHVEIVAQVGDVVSLLAVGGRATGVTTTGLAWPLANAEVKPGVGLGLSNRMAAPKAEVVVNDGTLLVIVDRTGLEPVTSSDGS
jgi:thiamine pyrophosphokinase